MDDPPMADFERKIAWYLRYQHTTVTLRIFPQSSKRRWHSMKVCSTCLAWQILPEVCRLSRISKWAWMMWFVSPYLASKIFLVTSYLFAVIAIPLTNIFGSTSRYPWRKTCLLIFESETSSSMKDRNCSQNRDQFLTLPAEDSNLIAGSFTESVTKPVERVAVAWVDPWMLNRGEEAERSLSKRILASSIARFVPSIYSLQAFTSSSYS